VKPSATIVWRQSVVFVLCALAAAGAWGRLKPLNEAAKDQGQLLYRDGLLPNGQPLRGERPGSGSIEGKAAACGNCHRRSGFGVEEGRIVIPPINGKYLFRASTTDALQMAHPGAEAAMPRRNRYTSETLARAIREGVDPDGRSLDYLMPRFALDDATMSLLTQYLAQLSARQAPGAVGDFLEFATVVTPDADPVKRDAMLDVLNHFFGNKNAYYRGADPPLQSERRIHFRVLRRWQLSVWTLTGPPDTWQEQLRQRFKEHPVFALLSGIGSKTWEPVHRFCESEQIPCLMPNVDLPVVDENDFYPVYFSRGVLLEADVIANRVGNEADKGATPQVVQVFRPGDIGSAAAKQLAASLGAAGGKTTLRELKSKHPAGELADIVRDAAAHRDVLVLWLRPEDLKSLPASGKLPERAFISGLMGGLENAPLPEAWRDLTLMSYPFDLPSQRAIRMNYPLGWFRIQHVPVVDERVQTDTYLACSVLAEAASTMLDNFVPDYLMERMEVELSHRLINGYYPRLGLAPGQRFASKGAYLVRFSEKAGKRIVVTDGDWVVP
jgi:hypothetical protein